MESSKRVLISECEQFIGEEVVLKGWVKKIRQLGKVGFLLLRDRTGVLQCVLEQEQNQLKIETESVVQVTGILVKTDKTANGVELQVNELIVLAEADSLPFEINKKKINVGLDHLLNHRVLSLRQEQINAIFTIQSMFVKGFADFLMKEGFTRIFTPKIVSQGAEGGANVFTFSYFDKNAYLAQSPQFYKQMMVGAGFERVFEIAPVYRAEEHNSSRHLNEYISLDVEIGFIENVDEVMEMEKRVLQYAFQYIKKNCQKQLDILQVEVPVINEIPKMTLAEAQKLLKEKYHKDSPEGDLNTEGERCIGSFIREKHGSDFVFITNYPRATRPMYTMPNKENPELTDSFDLLYKGSEITSGGQRIHRQAELIDSFKEKGLNPKEFKAYIDSFAYAIPPHGGFGIGLERIIMKFLGLGNIREASAFPRDCDRLIP
ncbi:aspartate--tRNA(Asn) ligase [Niallia sp. FSL W8-0635]|uniref:aspartate--tRNA(Asn) ligase n=1 Tax=Niallia sp. FSL W8-0635 TaxID=2975337 RepID=UPI0009C4D6D2|nr:aspartyl-tRNA synthetase [Mycobacteroides abscessus subsp. abscessus]HEO8420137.1 aspartate--tRNA(Asn) ligase [Yersinia enterocolitica]